MHVFLAKIASWKNSRCEDILQGRHATMSLFGFWKNSRCKDSTWIGCNYMARPIQYWLLCIMLDTLSHNPYVHVAMAQLCFSWVSQENALYNGRVLGYIYKHITSHPPSAVRQLDHPFLKLECHILPHLDHTSSCRADICPTFSIDVCSDIIDNDPFLLARVWV